MENLGGYHIEVISNVLYLRSWGYWTEEIATEQAAQSIKLINQYLCKNDWAVLTDLSDFNDCDVNCYAVFDKLNIWSREHGQQAEAIVHNLSYKKIKSAENANQSLGNIATEYFDNKLEACTWLKSQGFIVNLNKVKTHHKSFIEHGNFSIEVKRDGVICTLNGSWNNETTRAFVQSFQHLITANFTDKQWVVIIDFSAWQLAIPETYDTFLSHMYWAKKHGQIASFDIITGEFQNLIDIFLTTLSKNFDDQIPNTKVLSIEEALVKAKLLGYNLD
ncbi:MAG: hypothetical protein JKX75_09265 [Gammaproteobacteria bacterium]|nr:hypothetical protein [Gammaproteobacteria bacterium]